MAAAHDAFIAANRFGLGPRPGELAAIGRDPRGWLRAQVKPAAPSPSEFAALPPASDAIAQFFKVRKEGARSSAARRAKTAAAAPITAPAGSHC